MATKKMTQRLYKFQRPTRWTKGIGSQLPVAYKKFWKEWKLQKPVAVHYIEKEDMFEKHDVPNFTSTVTPVQNIPLPLKYPPELNDGIWGGEAVVQGFVKKSMYRRRVPKFWVPNLKRSVVYSEVLNSYMRTVVTERTMQLIHENYGFDHYLLKTPACDLRSELALSIKRKILLALADKTLYPDDPDKREEVYAKYQQYLASYTREEIEWYGLSFKEACKKWISQTKLSKQPIPLKLKYRSELIEKLKEAKIQEALNVEMPDASKSTWISKINPFAKNPKP